MFFYSNYYKLFKNVYQTISQLTNDRNYPVETLLSQLDTISNRPVELEDVEDILKALFYISKLLSSVGLADFFQKDIVIVSMSIGFELTSVNHIDPLIIDEELLQYWLDLNFFAGSLVIKSLGFDDWLETEIQINKSTYHEITLSKNMSLQQIVLNELIGVKCYPPIEWYFSLTELSIFKTVRHPRQLLVQHALDNHDFMRNLDEKYPGFLEHLTYTYQDLKTYCLLMPDSFQRLLFSESSRRFQPDLIHTVRIIDSLNYPLDQTRAHIARLITNIHDLASVVRAYPVHCTLIADEVVPTESEPSPFVETSLGALIQNPQDLQIFDLNNALLQRIILNIPRLRALAALSDNYLVNSVKKPANNPGFYGLFKPSRSSVPLLDYQGSLDSRLLTQGQLINITQFAAGGYYDSGNIVFGSDNSEDAWHFHTEATDGPCLAIALSYKAFELWQQLPPEREFEIMECGAGDGSLCFKMLHFIAAMAKINPEWLKFKNVVHYSIIEIAAALVIRQQLKLEHYITNGVVDIIHGDALKMDGYNRVAQLHLSNELMDMFSSEQITISQEGTCQVVMSIPVLIPAAYYYLSRYHPHSIEGLMNESNEFLRFLMRNGIDVPYEGLVITANRFKQLLPLTASKSLQCPQNCFLFINHSLPLSLFPPLETYLKRHETIHCKMLPGDTKIISPDLEKYAALVKQKALFAIIIDYGNNTFHLNNGGYRTYGGSPCFLASPGRQDITFDVDFTAFSDAMKKDSQGAVKVMLMRDLMPESMVLPDEYFELCTQEMLERFNVTGEYAVIYSAPAPSPRLSLDKEKILPIPSAKFFKTVEQRAEMVLAENRKNEVVVNKCQI